MSWNCAVANGSRTCRFLHEPGRGDLERGLLDVGDLLVADLLDRQVERHGALADAERAERMQHQLGRRVDLRAG